MTKDTHYKLTADDVDKLRAALPTYSTILDSCKGRNGLRTGKPNQSNGGLTAYVWRMARFHGGADCTMPVCASFDLQNWVDSILGIQSVCVCGTINDSAKVFLNELDKMAEKIVVDLGGDPNAAAKRWGRAMGMF